MYVHMHRPHTRTCERQRKSTCARQRKRGGSIGASFACATLLRPEKYSEPESFPTDLDFFFNKEGSTVKVQQPKGHEQIRASSKKKIVVSRRVTLRERGQVGWAYWALNGASPDRSGKRPVDGKEYKWANETFGLFHMDYLTTRNPCI